MTTQPKTIDSPLLGTTFVAVNRGVLMELMSAAIGEVLCDDELDKLPALTNLRDAVEQGRIDVLDAATWEGRE